MKQTHLYRVFEDIHPAQFLAACCIMAMLLETVLVNTFRQIQYLDEAAACLMGAAFILIALRERRIDRDEIIIIVLTVLMVILGFAGNLKHGLVHSRYLWCLDAFNMFKFIASSLGAVRLFSRSRGNEYIIRYLTIFAEVVIFLASIFLVINCVKDIHMSTDIRYGFRTFNFVFKRVGDFYEACLYMLMIFFADLYVEKRKITWVFIALTILNMASTLRSRAFAYAALFILFYIVFVVLKVKKVKLRYAVPLVAAAAVTFAGQFVFYFSGNTARNVLLRFGVRTMKAYFPIGSGFATYGTAVAQKYYSRLYLRYGFWQYYGTSMKFRGFLLDNYWPAVMAELGFFGALFMSVVILLLFLRNIRMCNNPYSKICVYSCWIAMFISSTVSSAFLAGTKAMVMAALVGVLAPLNSALLTDACVRHGRVRKEFKLQNLTGMKRFLIVTAALLVFSGAVLGIRYRQKIREKFFPDSVEKVASIDAEKETMIYDGTGDFDPYTDSLKLKNARLKDKSFRNRSVQVIREAAGERYETLTDEEIEAVTGERVVGGLTKAEVMRKAAEEGKDADVSAFEKHMSEKEREEILAESKALDEPFDLQGAVLSDVLSVTVATAETGNFRDRLIYYYYRTYSNSRKQAKRPLRLEGSHLPAMLLPETVPEVTRAMLDFESSSRKALYRKYTAFADYFGIVTHNGFHDDENKNIIVEQSWDPLRSQQVRLKFRHDTLYGLPVNRQTSIRVRGPEITLTESAVTIRKDSDFDPYDYIVSVLDEAGRDVRGLLSVDNPVKTDKPGFYSVTYSCGEDSVITLRVCVKPQDS